MIHSRDKSSKSMKMEAACMSYVSNMALADGATSPNGSTNTLDKVCITSWWSFKAPLSRIRSRFLRKESIHWKQWWLNSPLSKLMLETTIQTADEKWGLDLKKGAFPHHRVRISEDSRGRITIEHGPNLWMVWHHSSGPLPTKEASAQHISGRGSHPETFPRRALYREWEVVNGYLLWDLDWGHMGLMSDEMVLFLSL